MATFTSTAAKIDKLALEFSGTAGRKRLERVARLSVKDVDAAVRAELGDDDMSGWRRSAPIPIKGAVFKGTEVAVVPAARSAGPMRVLEQGRNITSGLGAMAGPGVSSDGTTMRKKNGKLRKVRARKARRWNGYTDPKGTWSDAEKRMRDAYPKRMADELDDAMAKFFMRG